MSQTNANHTAAGYIAAFINDTQNRESRDCCIGRDLASSQVPTGLAQQWTEMRDAGDLTPQVVVDELKKNDIEIGYAAVKTAEAGFDNSVHRSEALSR